MRQNSDWCTGSWILAVFHSSFARSCSNAGRQYTKSCRKGHYSKSRYQLTRKCFVVNPGGRVDRMWPFAKPIYVFVSRMSSEYHTSTERSASLEEETRTTIEEARMVLPGIQALFGFQLIAVFNTRFHDFTAMEQVLHLIALLSVAFAIVLIMTPAAYHRIAERGIVSRRFIDLASRFLELAMVPLMLGISLDLFLLGRLILNNVPLSTGISVIIFLLFFSLWYVFPWTASIVHARGKELKKNVR